MAEKGLGRKQRIIRVKHSSLRTERAYLYWARRFILFHGKRHPASMGATEVSAFLAHLAVERQCVSSTQNQAPNALLFLYRQVLEVDLHWLDEVIRAMRPVWIPVELSVAQVPRVLANLAPPHDLVGRLLYGPGLRIGGAEALRVKDVDLRRRSLIVRDGKGANDRATVLADSCSRAVGDQIQHAVNAGNRRAGTRRPVTCHGFRHSFAIHLLKSGADIRTDQKLLGQSDVRSTMLDTQVIKRDAFSPRSPLDALG
ncbi:MAG: hypothetical protein Kow0020_13340 [Wenzhouxiangellaceae bacterium]